MGNTAQIVLVVFLSALAMSLPLFGFWFVMYLRTKSTTVQMYRDDVMRRCAGSERVMFLLLFGLAETLAELRQELCVKKIGHEGHHDNPYVVTYEAIEQILYDFGTDLSNESIGLAQFNAKYFGAMDTLCNQACALLHHHKQTSVFSSAT